MSEGVLDEDLADEARDKEVAKVSDDMLKRYKTLYGDNPEKELSFSEIQERIRTKLPRPYKL